MASKLVTEGNPVQEITIPVPWGHIAAKSWNSSHGIPVLLTHGIMDNAGSFDDLVPLLPKFYNFVAIDFPGHGKSSHFTSGLPLKFFDFVLAIEYVIDHLKWENFIYIGHSFGGYLGYFYCAIFPARVQKLLLLDAGVYVYTDSECVDRVLNAYQKIRKTEEKIASKKAPEYSYDEAVKRIRVARSEPLNQRAAENLAKRCFIKSENGYVFSMDQRLKDYETSRMSTEQTIEMVKRIKCPILLLRGTHSMKNKVYIDSWRRYEKIKRVLEESLDQYRCTDVDGDHNVMLNNPEKVSKFVAGFLSNTKSQL